jgi:hypothetical protein
VTISAGWRLEWTDQARRGGRAAWRPEWPISESAEAGGRSRDVPLA